MPSLSLVTRGDDAGLCHTANVAIRDACKHGILRNVSMMVPAPAFAEAAEMFRELPRINLGLHVDLTAEWLNVGWGPVASPAVVYSLVNNRGWFPHNGQELTAQGAQLEHMQTEVEAQLHKARDAGLAISYLDEHMGIGWVAGFSTWLEEFCQIEGLINNRVLFDQGKLQRLVLPGDTSVDASKRMIAGLSMAEPGTYLLVGHPVYETEEMQTFVLPGASEGTESRLRNAQRRWFMAPAVIAYCREHDVKTMTYSEIV